MVPLDSFLWGLILAGKCRHESVDVLLADLHVERVDRDGVHAGIPAMTAATSGDVMVKCFEVNGLPASNFSIAATSPFAEAHSGPMNWAATAFSGLWPLPL